MHEVSDLIKTLRPELPLAKRHVSYSLNSLRGGGVMYRA